jgi:hypothetical protein
VRLDVHERDPIEGLDLLSDHHLNLQIEQLEHAQVLGPRDAVHATNDRCLTRAAEDVAQREAAGNGVRVRIVVEEDEDAVGVGEEALILLNALASDGTSELDEQRRAGEFGQREARDLRELLSQFVSALGIVWPGSENPDQRAACCPHRLQDFSKRPASVVFDDETRAGRDVGLDVGVDSFWVADTDAKAGAVEAARQRGAFNQDVELAVGCEHCVEQPHDQLRMTDREGPHSAKASRPVSGISIPKLPL